MGTRVLAEVEVVRTTVRVRVVEQTPDGPGLARIVETDGEALESWRAPVIELARVRAERGSR